jgi:probable phosphoglycerate mutase
VELLLVRHGEPQRIEPGSGMPADPGLTAAGQRQAERLARWLAADGADAVVSGSLRRARETAAPIAEALGCDLVIDDAITEYDARADHYISVEELRRTDDQRWRAMIDGRGKEFGSESPAAFRARVIPAVDAIIAAHPGRRVVLVGHGGVINVYLAQLLDIDRLLWFEPEYTSVSRIAAARSGVRSLVSLNETGHLVAERKETA